jgi:hypothetical protein
LRASTRPIFTSDANTARLLSTQKTLVGNLLKNKSKNIIKIPDLAAININLEGASKIWFSIGPENYELVLK